MPRKPGFGQELCADMHGFSLHAAVCCEADDRQGLERLFRYIARPALAYERVQCNAAARPNSEVVEPHDPHRWVSPGNWARLLKAVFEIALEHCPKWKAR